MNFNHTDTPGPGYYDMSSYRPNLRHKIQNSEYKIRNTAVVTNLGPGSYNPKLEAIKARARTIKIHQPPVMSDTNKLFKYIDEFKPIKKPIYKKPLKKHSLLHHRKPIDNTNSTKSILATIPGPGSYDILITDKSKTYTFSAQEYKSKILNKDNKFIIITQDDTIPEVGSYFKGNFFRWKTDSYPSYAFSKGDKSRNGIDIEKVADTPGPGNYNISDKISHKNTFKFVKPKHTIVHDTVKESICNKLEVREKKPIKPKFHTNDHYYEKPNLLENTKIEDNIEFEEKIRKAKEAKEKIKNMRNIANNISFNSHRTKIIITRNITPGPGCYETSITKKVKAPLINKGKYITHKDNTPGFYHKTAQWIKPSYNITIPNNIVHKIQQKLLLLN